MNSNTASNQYQYYLDHFTGQLPIGEAFDLVERHISIGGKKDDFTLWMAFPTAKSCSFCSTFSWR